MTKSLFHTLSAAWSLLVWSILISSCTDDLKSSQTTDRIRFTSAIDNTWTSLATDGGEGTRSAVSALRTEGTPLYLHTLYTDSIQPPSAENAGDSVPVTRSAPRDIASMYGTFGVSAYAYQGTWDNTGTPNYMNDVAVSKSGNAWTPSAGSYYWPGASYTMRFYAYAPKGNSAYTFSTSGIPTLTCAIPSDVAGQQDLLVAASGAVSGGNNEAIGLTFRHALGFGNNRSSARAHLNIFAFSLDCPAHIPRRNGRRNFAALSIKEWRIVERFAGYKLPLP